MKKQIFIISFILLVLFAVFSGCTGQGDNGSGSGQAGNTSEILVYCGAGMSEPMEEIASRFTAETGIVVNYNFGGSGTLLSQMELTEKGDVYMPGSTADFNTAMGRGFIVNDTEKLVVYHVPVIAVPKGNPAGITCLADLGNEGVKVELGDASACAIGKLSNKIIEKNGLNETIYPNVVTRAATVNEIVLQTSLGTVDGSIIWEDLGDSDDLEIIYIPNNQNIVKIVPIGVMTFSESPDEAEDFVEYVSSEKGLSVFEDYGFTTYPADNYADVKA
ncbi:molybdenum ABC transporter, periplasmic molybdate-binding protein [Methanolacinia petrolearia DSM 11571]|uniref:Molybdenum ABC transporter, periplasmic molybdate-binding protein n=1 Tax=Methanolacinia petrolearia (strain DSM 11571 / OCM 486 / SEBR 4847) TaxID=679926 RepID=E1RGZ4_METP4|nr:molybdate ABC transporter substrate-binding protein [Methanolacinia petrolearia]ADN37523.1 molybdenum ABC transporter, periplasmic molybdate-binding protein [Methanolacinia petrolearia DSM 11571]